MLVWNTKCINKPVTSHEVSNFLSSQCLSSKFKLTFLNTGVWGRPLITPLAPLCTSRLQAVLLESQCLRLPQDRGRQEAFYDPKDIVCHIIQTPQPVRATSSSSQNF